MSQIYIEYSFKVSPLQPGTEILIAELGHAGFESFVENEEGVEAYIQKVEWREDILTDIQILNSSEFEIEYQSKEIDQINWNEEWEKNFDPILVNELCAVRAPFHEPYGLDYEIVIEPKMSFGTGHHETTFMMLTYILEGNFENKRVLDMGCGTSVLAILASMKGAKHIDAIDIDSWCVENSEENANRNNCTNIEVILGGAEKIPNQPTYHSIIANINRNILLQDLNKYINALMEGGTLYLSGFYKNDLPIIVDHCTKMGLEFVNKKQRNDWVAAKFLLKR